MASWPHRRLVPAPVLMARGLGAVGLGALDPSAASTMAATIQRIEGYYPGSIAYRNNNPGNLVYVGQSGATAGAGGFAHFDSYAAGYDALLHQLDLYAARGLTLNEMFSIYAPASQPGNNPTAYALEVARALGVTPDTSLVQFSSSPALDLPGIEVWGLPDPSAIPPAVWGIAAGLLLFAVLR